MNYVIVTQALCFPCSDDRFASESAFAEHLRQLRGLWVDRFERLVVVAPVMSEAAFREKQGYWADLDAVRDEIVLIPMHPMPVSRWRYWSRHLVPNFRRLKQIMGSAGFVHGGPSHVFYPFAVFAMLLATRKHIPTLFVLDIDERRSAWMNFKTRRWSLRSYLLARLIYDPFLSLQTWFAVRCCSLVLLKGGKLVDDVGGGRPNVKNFIDSAFSAHHVIPSEVLQRKIRRLEDHGRPLEIVYFGRLTGYKGLDRSIEAVAAAIAKVGLRFRFHIIGAGESEDALRALAEKRGIAAQVVFHGPVPFGPQLFQRLYDCDLLLATPLSEDTPRNALDAMASGVPILAFDTYYYQDLHRSGAVDLVPWPSVDALATRLVHYDKHREDLRPAILNGVAFARDNTQEIWLRRRYEWTCQAMSGELSKR